MKRALPLLFLFMAPATLAESGTYQVEVIVFRNLSVATEATPVAALRSFAQLPALLEPAPALESVQSEMEFTEEQETEEPSPIEEPGATAPEPVILRPDLPDDLRVVNEKSRAMDDAWRRLKGSRDYRPLLYAGWEQNRVDYYPPIRVHGAEVIETRLQPPTSVMVADLTADDPLAAYRNTFYRLDGSVQLRRSRFLHVYLDLEYRGTGPWAGPDAPEADTPVVLQADAGEDTYTVFRLKQNRQVRTGQMHYFDTPQIGVLVLVTAIAPEAKREPAPAP